MSNNNVIYSVSDMQEMFIMQSEAYAQYVFYTLSLVKSTTFSLSSYQHLLNMLFIIIMFIIIYVLYRDIIFRDANNFKRCKNIIDTIAVNENYDKKFVYKIYVILNKETKDILKNYIFYIEYDFPNNKTNVVYNNNIDHDYLTTNNFENAFVYFDLKTLNHNYLTYRKNMPPYNYINKKILTNGEFKYIPVSHDKSKIHTDEFAKKLANFVKKFGFDKYDVDLYPIFDIINAVEYKRNNIVI
tara:strand:+ start:4262 stop:4987 length:726 start_codon:yes stop_codon:yes gene_type:complete